MSYSLKLGDTAIPITYILKADGVPYDLTGWTGNFVMKDKDDNIIINSPCTVANQSLYPGRVSYAWQAADFEEMRAGNYRAEWQMTRTSDGAEATFPRGESGEGDYIPIVVSKRLTSS